MSASSEASRHPSSPKINAKLKADAALVAQGALHPDCSAALYPARGALKAVVLMLHGFTAGPWQMREMSSALQPLGLTCYAARLPGHGATAGGAFVSSLLPKSAQAQAFAMCADEALDAAAELADAACVPLHVVGISAGGALTADLLLRRGKRIGRAVLIAPFLCPMGRHRRIFFRLAGALPGAGSLLDRIAFAWKQDPVRDGAWVRPGHSAFHLGNVGALFSYVRSLYGKNLGDAHLARGWNNPSQFILTATDDKVDARAVRRLVKSWRPAPALWWFAAEANVPHAMLSREENPNGDSRAQIVRILSRFLGEGAGSSNT